MSQVVPAFVGTVRTGIPEGLASGTPRDIPNSPSFSWDCHNWDSRGLASGTSQDVPSSPSFCWDCQDWDSRRASIWDFLGCPK